MIYNVNTEARIEAIVQTPGGRCSYTGDARIDGVPGTAAPIVLNFMDVVGSVAGKMLPTGNERDMIDGIDVTCIDVAMPMILLRAQGSGADRHRGPRRDQSRTRRCSPASSRSGSRPAAAWVSATAPTR